MPLSFRGAVKTEISARTTLQRYIKFLIMQQKKRKKSYSGHKKQIPLCFYGFCINLPRQAEARKGEALTKDIIGKRAG